MIKSCHMNYKSLVMLIVPVYGVEKYIEKCSVVV